MDWAPQCGKKLRYADKRAAMSQINLLMKRRRNHPEHLRAYACLYCGGWHITHKEDQE